MREAEIDRVAFDKEKELTDRALKLVEVGKPKSNWELQGVSGMAVFVNSLRICRVKEWRVTLGVTLAVPTVSSFVPV